jgi:hypothetical protein
MLIVSKFHDYYDTASAFGIDKAVVYNRNTKFFKSHSRAGIYSDYLIDLPDGKTLATKGLPKTEQESNRTGNLWISKWVVGFCGQFHVVVSFRHVTYGLPKETETFCHSAEEVSQFVERELVKSAGRRSRYYYRDRETVRTDVGIKTLFDLSQYTRLESVFQAFKVPVFAIGSVYPQNGFDEKKGELTINPCLKQIKFMRIKDPATAYQDIYSYISGVLGVPANPMVEVSDEVKAASRGHDGKYSFKKPPGGGQWR